MNNIETLIGDSFSYSWYGKQIGSKPIYIIEKKFDELKLVVWEERFVEVGVNGFKQMIKLGPWNVIFSRNMYETEDLPTTISVSSFQLCGKKTGKVGLLASCSFLVWCRGPGGSTVCNRVTLPW